MMLSLVRSNICRRGGVVQRCRLATSIGNGANTMRKRMISSNMNCLQQENKKDKSVEAQVSYSLEQVDGPENLFGKGGPEGVIPTDLDQATGLDRLEVLAKIDGVDVFDLRPLDASRTGTMKDPIIVESFEDHRYVGCSGSPADSHEIIWVKPTIPKVARCPECGSVYKLKYVGPEIVEGAHHH